MNSWNQFLEFLAKVDGEYVESVDWFGLLSKTKEELVAKERELSDKATELDALKKVMEEEKKCNEKVRDPI